MCESGADVTYLLGAMVSILMARAPEPIEREHHVRVALAPATPARLFDQFRERFGIQLVEGYGSTETNCAIAAPTPAQGRGGYMGTVRPGFHARVVDEHDQPVDDGTPGELVLRHDEAFAFADGYHGMPDQTVRAWRNLWFHTGDRVVRDADGWYRFLDRAKDAIRRRGENISSWEVEQVLVEHPAVQSVAVFPVPSPLGEDEVMTAIVLEPGTQCTPQELIAHAEPRLPYFAVPRYVEFVDALPLTENGKVRKQVLRERGVTTATWDREAAVSTPA
jgi:crotonobetaine/carnitine-CoA ligase